jgi:hypothetical protein
VKKRLTTRRSFLHFRDLRMQKAAPTTFLILFTAFAPVNFH